MEIALVLVTGTLCIACFFIGVRTGQKVSRGEDVKLPSLGEIKREHDAKKKEDKDREKLDITLENLDNYDGTGRGQKDIPR